MLLMVSFRFVLPYSSLESGVCSQIPSLHGGIAALYIRYADTTHQADSQGRASLPRTRPSRLSVAGWNRQWDA